ncbi:MAG: diguanylate cyclase [Candidatus Xenobia bacterium]
MPRLFKKAKSSDHKILVVDDSEEVLSSTRLLLERDGHDLECCNNPLEAVDKIKSWQPHLVVLDFFMPEMTGEEVVTRVRRFDHDVQILLQTGYASEKPPRDMLQRLDIQGYHDKSEGPEKLLVWVDASLKAYRSLNAINKSRQGLRYILDVVPEMHKFQSLEELLQGVLFQMEGLLGAHEGFVATLPEVLGRDDEKPDGSDEDQLMIVAGTGAYRDGNGVSREQLDQLRKHMEDGQVQVEGSFTVVPLRVGNKPLGIIYFDRATSEDYDGELLNIFAVQAAMALENCRLFGMATEDNLTRFFVRNFFFKRLDAELTEAGRYRYPLAFAIIDIDKFKPFNDEAGHQMGDVVLKQVSHSMRATARDYDFLGRYGGDEFVMAMPHTDPHTAMQVLEGMRRRIEELQIAGLPPHLRPTISVGVVTVLPDEAADHRLRRPKAKTILERMVKLADDALYKSKEGGRNRVTAAPSPRLSELLAAAPPAQPASTV